MSFILLFQLVLYENDSLGHILWSTIPSTPAFFIFDPKGRNEAQVPPPTTPFSKGGGNDCGVSQSFKDVWPLLNLS